MSYITTYEAAELTKIPIRTIRQAIQVGRIKHRLAPISKHRSIYLVDVVSLKAYQKKRPKRGRPVTK